VLFYDQLIEKQQHIPKPTIDKRVETCIKRYIQAGLTPTKTEFLTESNILEYIGYEKFSNTLLSIAYKCDFNEEWIKKWIVRENPIRDLINNFCEISYGNIVKSQVLLTGKGDVETIWGGLMRKVVVDGGLPDYNAPLILYFDTLCGTDSLPLSTGKSSNSIYSDQDPEVIADIINKCSNEFIKLIFDYIVFQMYKTIKIGDNDYSSYENIVKDHSGKPVIKETALKYLLEHFEKIRKV
jgi:hypothetical protein